MNSIGSDAAAILPSTDRALPSPLQLFLTRPILPAFFGWSHIDFSAGMRSVGRYSAGAAPDSRRREAIGRSPAAHARVPELRQELHEEPLRQELHE
jgi:hypothetical protein